MQRRRGSPTSFVVKDLRKDLLRQCSTVVAEIQTLLSNSTPPIVIAVDGGSGAGKSTIAALIQDEWDTALIPLDDFFSANISNHQWDEFTVEEKLHHVFDWRRLRHQIIEPLLQGKTAIWRAFDFASGLCADGTYGMQDELTQREPADVILLDGAYSAGPALADLLDLTIFVDVPVEERHTRLEAREDRDFLSRWHRRWDEVERYYFTHVRPKDSFDVVVSMR